MKVQLFYYILNYDRIIYVTEGVNGVKTQVSLD